MGRLILPSAGSVYVDANTVIYAVEKIEPYASFLAPLWSATASGQLSIITSELTWLETLTKPLMDGNVLLEQLFRSFLASREVTLILATLAIWEEAAKLRAFGLKDRMLYMPQRVWQVAAHSSCQMTEPLCASLHYQLQC